jgi:hypothetical protein
VIGLCEEIAPIQHPSLAGATPYAAKPCPEANKSVDLGSAIGSFWLS